MDLDHFWGSGWQASDSLLSFSYYYYYTSAKLMGRLKISHNCLYEWATLCSWYIGLCMFVITCASADNTLYLSICPDNTKAHPCVTPLSCICLSVPLSLMFRWSSWSCSSVSQPAWCGDCTESATGSRRGRRRYRTATSSRRRTSQSL